MGIYIDENERAGLERELRRLIARIENESGPVAIGLQTTGNAGMLPGITREAREMLERMDMQRAPGYDKLPEPYRLLLSDCLADYNAQPQVQP